MGGLKHSQKVGLFFGFPHYAYVRSLFPKTGCRPDPEEFGWVRLTKDILLDQGTAAWDAASPNSKAIFREIMGFHGFSRWFSWDFMEFNVDFTWISCGKHGRNHGESLMIMDT